MKELEEYFNKRLKSLMGCQFDDLTPKQKFDIAQTAAFAYYNLHKQMDKFKEELEKAFIEGSKNVMDIFNKMSDSLKNYK